MKTKYIDLVEQTFDWPQPEFRLENEQLHWHDVPLLDLIERYGSPLKFTYLPKITDNIASARRWFHQAKEEVGYEGEYHYCYCTKSSHFRYVLERVLDSKVHLETSSAYDIDLIRRLGTLGKLNKTQRIICNGFKKEEYVTKIIALHSDGYKDIIPIIDNKYEFATFQELNMKWITSTTVSKLLTTYLLLRPRPLQLIKKYRRPPRIQLLPQRWTLRLNVTLQLMLNRGRLLTCSQCLKRIMGVMKKR
jgi:hypothetical protein